MILQADARHIPLANENVHCVVTSPPYWGLRDYGCNGQLGLERTPEDYIANMVAVFREVRRVLRKDGTCWVNMGDGYAANRSYQVIDNKHVYVGNDMACSVPDGLKPKDLIGMPWRLAFALQADGWYLRSDIIWHKPNPMPESVTDRPTKSHEYLFLLAKSAKYFYDAEAIRESSNGQNHHDLTGPAYHAPGQSEQTGSRRSKKPDGWATHDGGHGSFHRDGREDGEYGEIRTGRNRRTVWTIPTEPYPEAHFATFPRKLVEPCILSGTSARGCCAVCGAPWERLTGRDKQPEAYEDRKYDRSDPLYQTKRNMGARYQAQLVANPVKTRGWRPTCSCQPDTDDFRDGYRLPPCTVLDPFAGSGTTVAVAESLGRRGIGLELKREYIQLAQKRMRFTNLGLPL